jgi:wyosine [tRNA(Phe)-imidazoG37] synthetase (radical SAM superfamily)
VGKTTNLTLKRDHYVPCDEILAEIEAYMRSLVHPPDYITLGGSGEPTLHSKIGTIITEIRKMTTIPVAVLTNGSLLDQDEVVSALHRADVVLPSLDAASDAAFRQICRPHPSITREAITKALKTFRSGYAGEVWLEILFCRGVNNSPDEVAMLKDIVAEIDPHKVHLNTVDRPPPEEDVFPLTGLELADIARVFGEKAEIVENRADGAAINNCFNDSTKLMDHLRR